MSLWYISFAMESGPLGATVIEAESHEMALSEATRLNINPGGEAAILPVPEGRETEARAMLNRLVSVEEILGGGGQIGPAAPKGATVIGPHWNA